MRVLKITFLIIAFFYLLLIGGLYLFQDNLMFHPLKLVVDFKEPTLDGQQNHTYKEYFLDHPSGITINAQLIKSKSTAKRVIYYLHGNRGAIFSQKIDIPFYLDRGYDVFMIDYQGYGKSEGTPSIAALEADVILGYDFLTTLYEEKEIVVLGHSLGSIPAIHCGIRKQPKFILLITPIYKVEELIKCKFPFIWIPFDFRNNVDNSIKLDAIDAPVHIFVSKQDHLIPFQSTIKFKDHLKNKDSFTIAKRAGHNNMLNDKAVVSHLNNLIGSSEIH